MTDLVFSFAPWILFLLADRFVAFPVALAIAGVVAVGVLVRAVSRHHLHMLDIANVTYFVALGIALVAVRPDDMSTWSRYAQGGAHGFLTLIIFGSILIGRPFTESYARDLVPAELQGTAEFHAINRKLSLVWGVAFLVGTLSLIVAGVLDARPFLFRLGIPFGALALALMYTQKQAGRPVTA
jgi:hypothetical protein